MPPIEDRYTGQGEYWDGADHYHLLDAEFKAATLWQLLQQAGIEEGLIEGQGLRLCDVGCGAGGVLSSLSARFKAKCSVKEARGYDISQRALNMARGLFPEVQFTQGSSEAVNAGWDLLVCCDVFEHVENPFAFLLSLTGKARFYAFHIPLDVSAENAVRQNRLVASFQKSGHIHQYCKSTALETLRTVGLWVVQWRYADTWDHMKRRCTLSWKSRVLRWPERLLWLAWPDLKVRLFGGVKLVVLAQDAPPEKGTD